MCWGFGARAPRIRDIGISWLSEGIEKRSLILNSENKSSDIIDILKQKVSHFLHLCDNECSLIYHYVAFCIINILYKPHNGIRKFYKSSISYRANFFGAPCVWPTISMQLCSKSVSEILYSFYFFLSDGSTTSSVV